MAVTCLWTVIGVIKGVFVVRYFCFVFFILFVAVTCLWTVIGVIKGIFVVGYFCFVLFLFCLWLSHVFGL